MVLGKQQLHSLYRAGMQKQHAALLTRMSASVQSNLQLQRYLATVEELFPNKPDFASRHIGPRKTDVVTMLNSIGFKVIISGGSRFSRSPASQRPNTGS